MKKYYLLLLLIGQLAFITGIYSQNIGINETGSFPDTSAMLDVSSSTKGFLAPRMTTTQQNSIPFPALGLLIFNTTGNVFKVNTGTPAVPVWTPLAFTGSGIISVNGLTGGTQTFAPVNSGSDFGITSSGTTHTFNLPTASLTNRGALSPADWSTFNNKKNNTDSIGFSGYTTLYQHNKTRDSLQTNITSNTTAIALKANKATTITINGTTQDLSANRTFNVGTLTATDTVYLHNKTTEKLQITDTANMRLRPIAGTNTSITGVYPNLTFNSSNGGGTVTSASVVTGNGFGGSVANAGTTPAITITTSVNGMVKGNGTALSAATAGTDYSAGTAALATGILKSTTITGTLATAVAADFPVLNQNTTGTAANVTGTVAIANGGTGLTAAPANGQIDIGNGTGFTRTTLTAGTGISVTNGVGNITIANTLGGTVTSASVVTGNGFAGSVANAGTTPAITIMTSVNGMVKGNGTALSAATAGTDYLVPNAAITGSINTKITYDSKGLVTAGASAQLASADFANQGTTTTILHGNAAGNPVFGSIVNADITSVDAGKITTGLLALARGGTNTDLSTGIAAGDLLIGTATGFSRLTDVATGSSLISGGAGSPSWGKIGLATHVSGTLPVANGGTGTTTTIQGGILFGASSSVHGTTAAGVSGQVLQSAGTGTPVWSTTTYPATSGPSGNYLRSDGTNIVSSSISPFAPNSRQSTPADPTGTTNSTGVMMGLGVVITPVKSGVILIIISGDISAAGSNSLGKVQIRFGAGSAPANGVALTGTAAGGVPEWNGPSNNISGFSTNAIVSSLVLSPATSYWVDLSLSAASTLTSVQNLSISIVEL